MSARHVHVIPVPVGMSAEEAWAEIVALGRLSEALGVPMVDEWAVIDCNGDECSDVEHA